MPLSVTAQSPAAAVSAAPQGALSGLAAYRFEVVLDDFFARFEDYCGITVTFTVLKTAVPNAGTRSHAAALLYALDAENAAIRAKGGTLPAPDPGSLSVKPVAPGELLHIRKIPYEESRHIFSRSKADAIIGRGPGIDYTHGTVITEPVLREFYEPGDYAELYRLLFPAGMEKLDCRAWRTRQTDLFDVACSWREPELRTCYDPVLDRWSVLRALLTE